jgi:hypothetical protein
VSGQTGVYIIGNCKLGEDQLTYAEIGKATTSACLFPGGTCSTGCPVYEFTGNGNWDLSVNWKDFVIPPTALPFCFEILINPVASGECVLNVPLQFLHPGSKITVAAGKKLRMAFWLVMQGMK